MSGRILLVFLCIQPLVDGFCKRGFGHKVDRVQCGDFEALNTSFWWYDRKCDLQYYYDTDHCTSEIENFKGSYVSTYWSFYPLSDYTCHNSVNVTGVIGPHEANRENQADVTPAEAFAVWPQLESNTTSYVPLVAPSAVSCGNKCNYGSDEFDWLDEFFRLCNNTCRVDYINAHATWCNATKTMEYFKSLYDRYEKLVWVTELVCRTGSNDPSVVEAFMEEILPLLDDAYYIYRYGWYMARIPNDGGWVKTSASLFYPTNSTLTRLGEIYYGIV